MVTAVLVSHDGARWLPDALAGLLGQERPVQSVMAADTGSADESAQLVTDALGADRVLHLARRTGFGQAVEEANRTSPLLTPDELPYLKRPSGWDPVTRTWRDDAYDLPELPHGEPVQWLWLLHDDSAPEPDALAQLLRVVDQEYELGREDVAVVGPKLRGWYDRRQLLEVGVTIAHSGRRWTGLDRREQDQGQHDHVRPVLSVSTAGMLIRRDIFDELGGFDRRLPLMRDDVDLCWRATAAGHRVLVAPEAVVRHAEAASRERRAVDCAGRTVASPHKVDKAGAVYTLLVNSRTAVLPWVLFRVVVGTVLRTVANLVGKVPGQALDEIRGLLGTLLRPERILAGRRRRAGAQIDKAELRPLFPPPGATVRPTFEQVAGSFVDTSDPRDHLRSRPARRRRRVRTRRRRRGLPGDRAVRAREAHRPQARPGALPGAAARLARRLPRPARRRRPHRRRDAARPGRLQRAVVPLPGLLAPGRRRRHPVRAAVPRARRDALLAALRLDRRRGHRPAGRLGPAGRVHRVLRVPPARRIAAPARVGGRRLLLPARGHRRASRAAASAPPSSPCCSR